MTPRRSREAETVSPSDCLESAANEGILLVFWAIRNTEMTVLRGASLQKYS